MSSKQRPTNSADATTRTAGGAKQRPTSGTAVAKTPAVPPSTAPTVPPKRAERRAEMIKSRREERLTQYERRKKELLFTKIGLGLVGVLIVAGIGWGAWTAYDNWREEQDLEGVADFQYAGGDHVNDGTVVAYTENPPVGGQHYNAWQNCGFYDGRIASENAVHSLEHGAVWITYRPDIAESDKERLREIADDNAYVLVSAYPDLQAPVVVQSWGHQLVLEGVDDDRLDTFVRVYQAADDVPEPLASCTGAVSTSTPV